MRGLLTVVIRSDRTIAARVAARKPPRWLRLFSLFLSRGFDPFGFLWGIGFGVLLIGGWDAAALAGALSMALSTLVFLVLKLLIARERPPLPIAQAVDRYSCPSGHSVSAAAFCAALVVFFPDLSLWFLLAAVVIGYSRIVLGLHYLSDVLIGLGLGAGIGELVGHVVRKVG
jgi:undecaprenyl-diphosphatase